MGSESVPTYCWSTVSHSTQLSVGERYYVSAFSGWPVGVPEQLDGLRGRPRYFLVKLLVGK